MRTIEQMVQSEILCCMSSVVSTLAQGYGSTDPKTQMDLYGLSEQAFELASPVPDYEEAAIQAGWEEYRDEFGAQCWRNAGDTWAGTAESLCVEFAELEPYDREVYEHWAVTDWFADKLIAHGEKVDKDFANLCVWARTTTGQAISMDHVVKQIYKAMMEA